MCAGPRLRGRAQRLAALAAEDTHEGRSARRMLDELIERNPDLAAFADAHASRVVTAALEVRSPSHVDLLYRLVAHHPVELVAHPAPDPRLRPRFEVRGRAGEVARFEAAWMHRASMLELLLRMLSTAWLDMVVPAKAAPDEDDAREDLFDDAEPGEDDAEDVWADFQRNETEWANRCGQGLARIPVKRVRSALRSAAALVADAETGSAGSLPPVDAPAWDDPELAFADFCVLFRAARPKSRRSEAQLRVLFRDGVRVNPATGSIRRIRTQVRKDWNF